MNSSEKSLILRPSLLHYFWYHVLGILTLPVGLGLLLIWVAWRRQRSLSFIITDQSISMKEGHHEQILALNDIQDTSFTQSRTQSWFGLGNIILKGHASTIILEGLKDPEGLLEKIDLAIEYERKRQESAKRPAPATPSFDPGSMDRMDTLTGLWQQGLISDEDYQEERKKFED